MSKTIIIVDYGMGNLHSLKKRISKSGGLAIISSDPNVISNSKKLVLPGVGHFEKAMRNLKKMNLIDALNEAVIKRKTPILGICLGMQIMAKHSDEGDCKGLGWIDANIKRFNIKDKLHFKVPHMGWNTIELNKESKLFKGISKNPEFYFVHSFYLSSDNRNIVLNSTDYETKFTSAIEKGNIYGVQYHPEKSHEVGNTLFTNFIAL
jgi:glutamine amidotransferase